MNREIKQKMENTRFKFRAWDSENECFWYSGDSNGQEGCELVINELGEISFRYGVYRPYQSNGEVIDAFSAETFEPTTLMQFTGLKDKNGKEIYEGDILKCNWETDSKGGYLQSSDSYCEHEKVVIVVWYNIGFAYIMSDGKYKSLPKNTSFEIIGNIYESPELLK